MVKNKVFLILSLCTIFSSFGAQELVSETKHLQLAFSSVFGGGPGGFARWLSGGDRILAFTDFGGGVELLDAKTGKLLVTTDVLTHWWKSFSPDCRYVAALCHEGLEILDTNTGLCVKTITEKIKSPLMVWSPNSRYLVIFEDRGSVRMLYDMQSNKLNRFDGRINCFRRDLTTISWCPNSQFFATYNKESVFLWDIQKYKPVRTFEHNDVRSIHWSTDGLTFITTSCDCAKLWNMQTGELIHTLDFSFDDVKANEFVCVVGFNIDGINDSQLLVISHDGTIRLCNVCTGDIQVFGQHKGAWVIQLSPDKKYLLTMGTDAKIWDIKLQKHIMTIPVTSSTKEGLVIGRVLSNDYFVVPKNKSLQLWDVYTGKLVQEEPFSTGWVNWSPDGKHLLIQSISDGCIKAWDVV